MTQAEYYVRINEIRAGVTGDLLGIANAIRAAKAANCTAIYELAAVAVIGAADDYLAKLEALDREDRESKPYLVKRTGR